MQEVTIKLTLDEAKELRTIIGNKVDESKSVADIICKSKESEIPAWLEKQISDRNSIFDKIADAITESYL